MLSNVSQCQQQQSYSGLRSPGRSYSTYLWNDSWVQTFHKSTSDRLWTVNTHFAYYRLLGQLIFVGYRTPKEPLKTQRLVSERQKCFSPGTASPLVERGNVFCLQCRAFNVKHSWGRSLSDSVLYEIIFDVSQINISGALLLLIPSRIIIIDTD